MNDTHKSNDYPVKLGESIIEDNGFSQTVRIEWDCGGGLILMEERFTDRSFSIGRGEPCNGSVVGGKDGYTFDDIITKARKMLASQKEVSNNG